jgi:biopolymer transport protein ExbD
MLPLIDIVFLLLVFFIYAMLSMAVHHALPVALPLSSTAPLDKQVTLSVTVDHRRVCFSGRSAGGNAEPGRATEGYGRG